MKDPDTIDADTAPGLREEVAFVPVSDEGLLYVERSGQLHRLDHIGTLVCSYLDGRTTIASAADQLSEAFQSDRAIVTSDVIGFVRELGRAGLLDGISGEGAAEDAG